MGREVDGSVGGEGGAGSGELVAVEYVRHCVDATAVPPALAKALADGPTAASRHEASSSSTAF